MGIRELAKRQTSTGPIHQDQHGDIDPVFYFFFRANGGPMLQCSPRVIAHKIYILHKQKLLDVIIHVIGIFLTVEHAQNIIAEVNLSLSCSIDENEDR